MSNLSPRRLNSLFAPRAKKERRPAGVSRRRKTQLAFESLESRQVMSASSIVAPPTLYAEPASTQPQSNQTEQGQQDILANELYWQSLISSQLLNTGYTTRAILPNDALFNNQWHLLNTGQETNNSDSQDIYGVPGEDLNVLPAWAMGYTGAGVTVAVIDSGTQLNHPDLAANINLDLSFDAINPSGNGNPYFLDPGNAHGTAVAGLIGAVANNGIGGAGVAPGVSLVPIRLIDFGATQFSTIKAFRHAIQDIDITNNSWGPADVRALGAPTPFELEAVRDSIIFGRGGLGIIHMWAAGNGAGTGFPPGFPSVGFLDSTTYDGWASSRYVIGVTAVDHDGFYNNYDGTHSGFAEIGAAVLVAAPSGTATTAIAEDTGIGSGLWTTDLTGDFGYNLAPDQLTGWEFDRDFLGDTDYTSRFGGTSGATPLATGVVALMLEANPNLSWRDVQEILVRSARQNHPLTVPANGFEEGHQLLGTQNVWIVNQMPVFHDPDPFIPTIPVDPFLRIYQPTLDPNITAVGDDPTDPDFLTMHYQPTPYMLTNSAGYTVSMGRGTDTELIGYGHGVIDAEMAVLLAEQWHTKDQALPNERTWTTGILQTGTNLPIPGPDGTNLPAVEVGNNDTGNIIVPGSLGGEKGFIGFWNEYFAPAPFAAPGHGPENTRGYPIFFSVPDPQAMSVESVEVKISLSGGTAAAMDNLRILLVSPDGTHSELNHFYVEPAGGLQNGTPFTVGGDGFSQDNGGDFIWTFTSKRHWGERSDNSLVYDVTTGEPMVNTTGFAPLSGDWPPGFSPELLGTAMQQGWQLHFENYGGTDLNLNGLEVVWHGSPVQAASQRVQGFVGVDMVRDGQFNYSRVIQQQFDLIGDTPNTLRFGEIQTVVDPNMEAFAKNVTVTVRRASDNAVVDQFVTGHDGNFYFDLVPDEYIISIDDPEGRAALDDSVTPAGVLDKYRTEWRITEDYFKVWDHASGSPADVVVDANGDPVAWLDGNGDEVITGMRGINFLLDPGEVPPSQATFSGVVYADINGDGVLNGADIAMPNVGVYADVNRNGFRDEGELLVETDATGTYNLLVTGVPAATVVNVGVELPTNWTATNPAGGIHTRFITAGDQVGNLDFFIKPPANNIGGGGANVPGFLIGTVFNDANNNGSRGSLEAGIAGVTVYLDANNNAVKDVGEVETTTNQFGAYIFTEVPEGQHVVRIVIAAPLPLSTVVTTPTANSNGHVVNLTGSSTISTLHFGTYDTAIYDFGDLPLSYDQRPLGGGNFVYDPARHLKGAYWLGASIDSEPVGAPSADADGDDLAGDDENGVVVNSLAAGQTASLTVTANTFTSYLQAWFDWNDDGDFNDAGERVVTDQLLTQGANSVSFAVPPNVSVSNVYARFRLGEHSHDPLSGAARAIDSPWGAAGTGEVEDYRFAVVPQQGPLVVGFPADFNQDDVVDGSDFLTWQQNVGMSTGATQSHGNTNGNTDSDVDGGDVDVWQNQFGATASALGGSTAASSSTTKSLSSARLSAAGLQQRGFDPSVAAWLTVNRPGAAGLVDRLRDLGEDLQSGDSRGRELAAERIEVVASKLADRFGLGALEVLQRDSAFESLFDQDDGENLLDDVVAELAASSHSDEAFAELGRHFRRGR